MKTVFLAPVLALLLAGTASAQTVMNVRDADIRAFIADAARVTGRTFIIDARVQGKVTVVTDHPVSRSQYFEIFLSTLRANNLVAVPTSNGAFRIQPTDNAASQPSRVGTRGATSNSYITEIVRLRSIDAQSAVDTVRGLISPQGSVTANRAGNSLVIVDFADNVRRVREVLRRIDSDNAETRIVALRNAGAREIATALQGLVGQGGTTATAGAPAASAGSVSVVAIASSNSVAIRGDAPSVARLAAIAEDLDRRAKNGTEIKVIFLENADAEQLLPVLQQLVGQTPSPITNQQLSASTFGSNSQSTGSSGSNAVSRPANTPAVQQDVSTTGGTTPAQTAISAGGRTASVVTRFVGANAIVIAAPAEVQRQLAEVVRQLDTRREQVLVEAIVAEVSDATASQLGAQFAVGSVSGGVFAASNFSNTAPSLLTIAGAVAAQKLATTTTTINGTVVTTSTGSTASDSLTQSALTSVLGATGGFGGFASKIGNTVFASIINALKSDTTSNLLQVPHLVVLDNQEAHSLVGQEIPITTGQALSTNFTNTFTTTQRENVGIELTVRPQVNSSGTVKLNLRLEVSSIAGPVSSNNSDLILNKREVETIRTVDDGDIAVISGLLDDNERRTIEKIPLLGDIPGLGNLFRSKAKSRTKTNLMIFIRPTILRTAEDSRKLTEQRYGYLRLEQGLAMPNDEPSIDQLVRDYMGAAPPIPSGPVPGNIDDPRIMVPVERSSSQVIHVKKAE
jgi:general secretion pathway protein D